MLGLGLRGRIRQLRRETEYFVSSRLRRPNLYRRSSPERFGVIFNEPHDMPIGDRVMLYALIRGLKPKSALEIGVRWGGSARIIANAMEDNGFGSIVGLDPETRNFRPRPAELHGRYRLVKGYSPEDVGKATGSGTELDFVFIDAVHTYSAVKQDFLGVLPHLAPCAHILFHDAFHQGVAAAIDEVVAGNGGLQDLGILSKNPELKAPVSYGGMRLVRFGKETIVDLLPGLLAASGLPKPEFSRSLWDHDAFAQMTGDPLGRRNRSGGGSS